MSITVRELMQLPHLQISLIVGEAGIDREVSWVHTSDLPNPWEWHGSGELLLTNGTGLGAEEPAQVDFVERLAESGASGLAIGLGTGAALLTGGGTRRADELALPVLTVPISVPFTAVDSSRSQTPTTARSPDSSGGSRASTSCCAGLLPRAGRARRCSASWATSWECGCTWWIR